MTECQHCGRNTERWTPVNEPLDVNCAEWYEEYDQTRDVDQHRTTLIHEVTA